MHYVYILECDDGSFYTGYSEDVTERFKKHVSGKGAKYTRSHKPKRIACVFPCKTKSEALKLEYSIKQLSHKQKEFLIKFQQKG